MDTATRLTLGKKKDTPTRLYHKSFRSNAIITVIAGAKERDIEIIKRKGTTTYAPASCVAAVIKAIVNNERREMPINAVLNSEYGLRDIAKRVSAIVSKEGIQKIIEYDLSDE